MIEANVSQASAAQFEEWRNRTLADLIQHIVATHHKHLREELPALETLLTHPAKNSSGTLSVQNHAEVSKIFRQFRRAMEEHMKKEEAILFPLIEKLETARAAGQSAPPLTFGSIRHPIAVMEQEHEQARKELAEIRNLTNDYTRILHQLEEQSCILERLKVLDADMQIHSRLEDEILFPGAIGLERM